MSTARAAVWSGGPHHDVSDDALSVSAVLHREARAAAPGRSDEFGVRLCKCRNVVYRCIDLHVQWHTFWIPVLGFLLMH